MADAKTVTGPRSARVRSLLTDHGDGAALLMLLVGACVVPLLLGPYGIRVATMVCMLIALAQAWNLIGGYAGLLSLAAPAFFGTGAVGAAVFLINDAPIPVAVGGSLVLSLLIALFMGLPTLRLQGHYFVVATLLVSEALRHLVLNFDAFNFQGGIAANIVGAVGLTALPLIAYNRLFYYVMLGLAAGTMLMILWLDHSRWGLALRAVRDGEPAAAALGVPAMWLKVAAFVASAAITSLVGTAWAFWLGTVDANDAYGVTLTFETIVMVFLGGRGTLWGPPLGVLVVLFLNEMIGVELGEVTQIVSGVIVVAIVMLQPDGLIQVIARGPGAFAPGTLRANLLRYRVK